MLKGVFIEIFFSIKLYLKNFPTKKDQAKIA